MEQQLEKLQQQRLRAAHLDSFEEAENSPTSPQFLPILGLLLLLLLKLLLTLRQLVARRWQRPAVAAALRHSVGLRLLVAAVAALLHVAAAWRAVAWRAVEPRTAVVRRAAAARAAVVAKAPAWAVAALGSGSLGKVPQETPPPCAGLGTVSVAASGAGAGAAGQGALRGAAPRTAALAACRARAGLPLERSPR